MKILKICGCSKKPIDTNNYVRAPQDESKSENITNKAVKLYNLACSLQDQGKLEEAIQCYKEAICLNPTDIEANYNLATALQELNYLKDAEKYYKRAIALKPDHHMAYYNMGYLYQDRNQLELSIECFKSACRIEPTDVDSYINLALVYKKCGIYPKAIQCYQTAIHYDPNSLMAYFNLGNVYQDIKDYTHAIECFILVIQLDVYHTDAMFNLAVAYHDRSMSVLSTTYTCTHRTADLEQAQYYYKQVYRLLPMMEEAYRAALTIENILCATSSSGLSPRKENIYTPTNLTTSSSSANTCNVNESNSPMIMMMTSSENNMYNQNISPKIVIPYTKDTIDSNDNNNKNINTLSFSYI